ncbi:MAG: zinc-binding dehydrogenase [Bacteriovoracia bacterium]
MKAWVVERHGGPEVLVHKEVSDPVAAPGIVRVRPRAIGLNHLDLWVRNGVEGHRFPLPLVPGCDVAGVEEKSGARVVVHAVMSCGQCAACRADFGPVCAQFGLIGETRDGGAAELIAVPERNLIPLPESVSFEQAACLPVAYVTAWSMLHRKAKLQSGETILIHAAGSGVSVACVQLAKMLGATVFVTASTAEKARRVKELGADHVIETGKGPFREGLKQVLKAMGLGRGVDVVIDHVGVATFEESVKSLNWGGRLVTCGATSGSRVSIDLKLVFFKNIALLGSTMGGRQDLVDLVGFVSQGRLSPVIDSEFSLRDLPKAYARLESRQAFGKVVVQS